jgi:3,4-dihydroxy 2-butanone 4-phosphate synthase
MIRYTSGYICAPITASRAAALDLPLMVPPTRAQDPLRTAYTISIDALGPNVSTGISAQDRSLSATTLADPAATSASFRRPGHLLPLIARDGGVRVRQGHTEAAVDMCRLAGCEPAAVIGEMVVDGDLEVNAQGVPVFRGARMMRRDDCLAFGRKFGIKVCTIEDLLRYVEDGKGKGR